MAKKEISTLRDFPSVEILLQSEELTESIKNLPQPLVTEVIRETIGTLKSQMKSKRQAATSSILVEMIKKSLGQWESGKIQKVLNATGIFVHTNLGRAPLGKKQINEISDSISGYNNLELNLKDGKRGARGGLAEKYLALLSGAESAAIVNNCAAAIFIILNTFAIRKKVLLSRGELVQIGGGFRIPDILKRSGAKLEEVGTTNITNLQDYSDASDESTSLILKVHKSNFIQSGFTKEVPLAKLSALAKKSKLLLVHDLGSGAVISTKKLLGFDEPMAQQSIRDGADLVCFSGDKMLGGVQAGMIVGKKELIEQMKKNPLFRAVRVDKFILATTEQILKSYLNGNYLEEVKLWKLLSVSEGELYSRAKRICKELGNPDGISVEATKGYIGGGGLPESAIPSMGLVFSKKFSADELLAKFRQLAPPVIGRIENDRVVLDLKTIDEDEVDVLLSSIQQILKQLPL